MPFLCTFSKFATKSAVALSRANFREICRGRSAVVALDDRLSRAWFSAQKSLARFARQGHATPTVNLSQVTSLDYLTLTIPKTRLTSQPTPDALQSVHTGAAQALAIWAGREPPPTRAPPRCARNGAPLHAGPASRRSCRLPTTRRRSSAARRAAGSRRCSAPPARREKPLQ